MKKRILTTLALVMVAAITFCFVGTAFAEGGKVTFLIPSNAEQLKGYQALGAQFAEEMGYEMEVLGASYGDLYPKLQSMIAAKQVPELNAYGTEFVPWASKGAMDPLDDYIAASGFDLSAYDPGMVASMQWNGKQWEIPYASATCVLFYNKDLFDAAGVEYPTHDWNDESWTTDAFIEMAKKLTLDANGKNALDPEFDPNNIVQYGVGDTQSQWFAPWFFGGDITDETATKYIGNEPAAAEGLQFIADLSLVHHVKPSQAQSEALAAGGNVFLTGRVAMGIDGTWATSSFGDTSFKWDIAATPKGTNHSVVLFTDGIGVGGSSANPDGGWAYINWLFNNEQAYLDMLKYNYNYMSIPARLDVQDKVKGLLAEKYPNVDLDVMFNAVKCEDAKPVYMRYSESWNKISTLLENEVYGPIRTGEKTAEQALADVADQVQSLLDGDE